MNRLIWTLLLLPMMACAHAAPSAAPDDLGSAIEPPNRVLSLIGALREARAHEFAAEAGQDLDRAEMWLSEAERVGSGTEVARRRSSLLLLAVEGRIAKVRALYERRYAERALDSARGRYAENQKVLSEAPAAKE